MIMPRNNPDFFFELTMHDFEALSQKLNADKRISVDSEKGALYVNGKEVITERDIPKKFLWNICEGGEGCQILVRAEYSSESNYVPCEDPYIKGFCTGPPIWKFFIEAQLI